MKLQALLSLRAYIIDEYTKEGNKVKYIRATDIYTPFLVGAEAGYLISGTNG